MIGHDDGHEPMELGSAYQEKDAADKFLSIMNTCRNAWNKCRHACSKQKAPSQKHLLPHHHPSIIKARNQTGRGIGTGDLPRETAETQEATRDRHQRDNAGLTKVIPPVYGATSAANPPGHIAVNRTPLRLRGAASGSPSPMLTPANHSWRSSPCPSRHRCCQNPHGRSYIFDWDGPLYYAQPAQCAGRVVPHSQSTVRRAPAHRHWNNKGSSGKGLPP